MKLHTIPVVAAFGLLMACGGEEAATTEAPADEAATEEAATEEAATEEVATAEAAGLAGKFVGEWQVKLSEEEQAQIDAMKKAAEENPDDMEAQLAAALVGMAEMTMTVTDSEMTMHVMGEAMTAAYTAEEKEGALVLTSTTTEEGVEKTETLNVSFNDDGSISMMKEGDPDALNFVKK